MIYKIPVTYEAYGVVEVEAKNMNDLMQKLKDEKFVEKMPLPDESDYVDETYKIEFDSLKFLNK